MQQPALEKHFSNVHFDRISVFCTSAVIRRALLSSALSASLLTWAELPWANAGAAPLAFALIAPWALVAGIGLAALARAVRIVIPIGQTGLGPFAARVVLLAYVGAIVAAAGIYYANVLLIDEPLAGYTLYGYLATALVIAVALSLAARSLRTSLGARLVGAAGWRATLTTLFFLLAVALAVVDANAYVHSYPLVHYEIEATALVVFAAASYLSLSPYVQWPLRARTLFVALTFGAFVLCVPSLLRGVDPIDATIREPTVHRRALLLARKIFDRDGDGQSAWLGGGDCDDSDPNAFPLSARGRDCLGVDAIAPKVSSQISALHVADVRSAKGNESPPAGSPEAPSLTLAGLGTPTDVLAPPAPDILLLLTIDAFRCGFGEGRQQLRDICPTLTRLAHEGVARLNAHATYPATSRSIDDIHTVGRASGAPMLLPNALAAIGYRPEAFITYPHLLDAPGMRSAFSSIDDSLSRLAMTPGGITSEALTDRILGRITALGPHEKAFFWAHYYDTHAPYVRTPGSRWATVPIESYAAEMRRTDAAIGRLLEGAARDGRDVVVIITADHGEEFGEHRGSRHGTTLYEEVVRIPIIAWRTGPDRARLVPPELPFTSAETGDYIFGLASRHPLRPTPQAFISLFLPNDTQYAIVKNGWKYVYHQTLNFNELYDLSVDRREHNDLSAARPDVAAGLRAELLAALARERQERRLVGLR